VFCEGLTRELSLSPETIDSLFPRLHDLVDIHSTFLDHLTSVQSLSVDRSIDSIGPVLIQQVTSSIGFMCSEINLNKCCNKINVLFHFIEVEITL